MIHPVQLMHAFFIPSIIGGAAGKHKGRVSDASMVGCGGYANLHGAATVAGLGESIIKMTLAREVVYMMEGGRNAQVWFRNLLCSRYYKR